MSVEMINNIIGIRAGEYKEYIGTQNMRQEDEQFLAKCALSEISKENVKGMYLKKPELRELLLKIYNNTVIKRTEFIENELTEVYETQWFEKAMSIVEKYEGSVNIYMLLNLINTIAATQPYGYYAEYFEEKETVGEDVNFVELLAMKNIYAGSTGLTQESISKIAGSISEQIQNILPDSMKYGSMTNRLEQLQNEIMVLENRKAEIIQDTEMQEKKLNNFLQELESQEARLKEQAEQDMREKYEHLVEENERLREENMKFKNEDGGNRKVMPKPKSKKKVVIFKGRKQRINGIIAMMIERRYTPEKIHLIKDAINKGVRLKDIEDIIEKNMDTGILRESIGILTSEKALKKGGN